VIEVQNVSKTYGSTVVVDDVSIDLPKGGLISIVGANGAGKSTLLSMISRLLPMSAGQVRVDGLDVVATASDVLAKRLSILRQENHVISRLSIQDLVAFGRYPHCKGHLRAEDHQHIERVIAYFGLDSIRHRFLDEVSGGQRQRAFIAMVLCQDTDYILLDEPLNNLDIKHAVSMMKLFRETAAAFSKTVVMVLHDINFASCYSDIIVAMRGGKIVRVGPPEDVVTAEVMGDVFGLETQIGMMDGKRIVHYYL
jgi:iron complex transport system ATP-binding protein